jgi:hypothetical protein
MDPKVQEAFEKLKAKLLIDLNADNLAGLSREEQGKLIEGIRAVPEHKMYEKAQHIFHQLLPKIEKSKGREDDTYKFYREVVDMLVWAIFIADRYRTLEQVWIKERSLRTFYQGHANYVERELLKYQTAEDIFIGDSMDVYAKSILHKAEQFFENSKDPR